MLLPAMLPLAAYDGEFAAAREGGGAWRAGADGLIWAVSHSAGLFEPDTLLGIDPGSGRLVRSVDFENLGDGLAVGQGAIWATAPASGAVLRIDLASGETDSILLGEDVRPESMVVAEGAVWVASGSDVLVRRIDPVALREVAAPQVGRMPLGVAVGDDAVWVASRRDESIARVDPHSNRLVATIPLPGEAHWVARAGGSVWGGAGSSLVRIDPSTNRIVATVEHSGTIGAVAVPP
jgi:DNA-binding beta-propeller fold protein YncE